MARALHIECSMNKLITLDANTLEDINGGIDRNTYTNAGEFVGKYGGAAGGAAAGAATVPGTGPGAAAVAGLAGAAGYDLGGRIGRWAGGKLWDAGTWIGDKVGNAIYGRR